MLYSFAESREKFGSPYQIDKAVAAQRLFKISSGIYSDTGNENELEIIQWRYPYAIFTLESAYFYHDLTDMIPDRYHLATDRKARVITDSSVKQVFVPTDTLELGKTQIEYNGDSVRTYNLERLLIETARNKTKLAPDLYKEVVLAFRQRTKEMDANRIAEYLQHFARKDAIESIIYAEVF